MGVLMENRGWGFRVICALKSGLRVMVVECRTNGILVKCRRWGVLGESMLIDRLYVSLMGRVDCYLRGGSVYSRNCFEYV